MLKSIDKVFWAVIGVVLPSGIIISLDNLLSAIPLMGLHVDLMIIAFFYIVIPIIYILFIVWRKKCSLLFISLGFFLSINIFYLLIPINNQSLMPSLWHVVYTLYALLFAIVSGVFTLILSKKRYLKQFLLHCNDKMERTTSKSTHSAKKVYDYIKKVFTDD